jgi:dCTP deaminase
MVVLADRDILAALEEGRITIDPYPDLEKQLGSVSVDFRLGTTFMVFEHSRFSYIDPRNPGSIGDAMRTIEVAEDEPFIMQPGDFALASTMERLELPDNLLGRLEGRSSIARLGITVHSTAAVFEPGWIGTATMELSNLGRMAVALYPGMRICAFSFETSTRARCRPGPASSARRTAAIWRRARSERPGRMFHVKRLSGRVDIVPGGRQYFGKHT